MKQLKNAFIEQIVHRVAEFSKKIPYLILINSVEYLIA